MNMGAEQGGDSRPGTGSFNFPDLNNNRDNMRPSSGVLGQSRPHTAGPMGRTGSSPFFTGTDFNPERSFDQKAHSRPATGKVPEYVTMDKQVARFYAHFFMDRNWDREGPLGEPELEREMCRLVTIQYYLYDNEIQILEPKVVNAGMPHGTFFRKGPLVLESGKRLELTDLVVGGSLRMLGQEFFITDADDFTRSYFRYELFVVFCRHSQFTSLLL